MTTSSPLVDGNVIPVWGLTRDECEMIRAKALSLISEGRAIGVSQKVDREYMCVFDRNREPYTISRERAVCHLFGPSGAMIARSSSLADIVETLSIYL